jgi:hypothetical protein
MTISHRPHADNLDLFAWSETQYRPAMSLAARRLSRTHRLRPTVACLVADLASIGGAGGAR